MSAVAVSLFSTDELEWRTADPDEVNPLLARAHYLGPVKGGRCILAGEVDGEVVAAQVWKQPTARRLPSDGSWLELARWCLTPDAGPNAGSRMHAYAVRLLRRDLPEVTTLVSYSDPSAGHTGALYKACNWKWAPTWHRLRPPPTGNGQWVTGQPQAVKDRWIFELRRDPRRVEVLKVNDPGAIRRYVAAGGELARLYVAE